MDKVREQVCQRALTSEHMTPVRGPSGLLEGLQCGVALETLGESESSLGAEAVGRDTASTGAEAGAEACQGALTEQTLGALVRAPSGPLQRLQCGVALESLGESGGSRGAKVVLAQTARMGAGRELRAVNGR